MKLKLNIITPERKHVSEGVEQVLLPGENGQFTVLPQHAPIVSIIQPGELTYINEKNEEVCLAVGEGFVEVSSDQVNVATDLAIGDDEIDENHVEEALKSAKEALKTKSSPEEIAALHSVIKKSLVQLRVKRNKYSHLKKNID